MDFTKLVYRHSPMPAASLIAFTPELRPSQLADSRLLQWFCRLELIDGIKAPSKSTLQRYDLLIGESYISAQIHLWLAELANPATLRITRDPLDFDTVFMDTTCLRTNIHFPVDWVLLRDATRTLVKAILVIRSHGLHHRMPEAESFISEMNRLSIEALRVLEWVIFEE